ncbi:hypothetical protein LCGC14_1189340 [marine sediment metagenome]|uniref:Uncharacterized protein n=1 Tax=marine sediment metagenome TaxID=412755 RepID=A0A0F9M7L9_9ZZZZ
MPRKAKDPKPDAIGDFSLVLTDYVLNQAPEPEEGEPTPDPVFKTFTFEVQVFDEDGNVMELIRGDLEDELNPGQIQNFVTNMDFFRNKALEEIINAP